MALTLWLEVHGPHPGEKNNMKRSRRPERRPEHPLVVIVAAIACFASGVFLGILPKYALPITIALTAYVVWRWKQRTDKIVLLTPVAAFVMGQIAVHAFGVWYRKQQ